MAVGNINAIKDWMENTWYDKEWVNDIFISCNGPRYDVNSPFYSNAAGSVCTAFYQNCTKTSDGESYNGILYSYHESYSQWVAFCLSLSQSTAQAMNYRYGRQDGTIIHKGRIWYYSIDTQIQRALGINADNTDPSSRRFYYEEGDLNVGEWLVKLLDTMNTN